jgi:hypothetical protein
MDALAAAYRTGQMHRRRVTNTPEHPGNPQPTTMGP